VVITAVLDMIAAFSTVIAIAIAADLAVEADVSTA
jgi:hypothetical protein